MIYRPDGKTRVAVQAAGNRWEMVGSFAEALMGVGADETCSAPGGEVSLDRVTVVTGITSGTVLGPSPPLLPAQQALAAPLVSRTSPESGQPNVNSF